MALVVLELSGAPRDFSAALNVDDELASVVDEECFVCEKYTENMVVKERRS